MGANVYLEIELERIGNGTWMRMHREAPEGTMRQDRSVEVHLDLDELRLTPSEQYGEALGRMLFAAPEARSFFSVTRSLAKQGHYPLRVHIVSNPEDPTFTRIRWERLADPDTGDALAVKPDVSITRLVTIGESRPLPRISEGPLRALIAIAVPSDVETAWVLPAIDRAAEISRIRRALYPIECEDLSLTGPVSPKRLGEELRKGYDLVFLMCHGREARSEVRLLLEENEGDRKGVLVAPKDLKHCVEGPDAPRVVIIASCYSAASTGGPEDGPVRATIGAELASAGIPVVLGISGSASIAGVAEFMEHFLRDLSVNGNVDLAATEGRRAVLNKNALQRQNEEWSSVILFSRLKDGDLRWAPNAISAGFPLEFERWDDLVSSIRAGRCVPVLGPGLLERVVGPLRDIARDLGAGNGYPLVEQRCNLPHVARYLETTQGRAGLLEQMGRQLREKAFAKAAGEDIGVHDVDRLDALIREAAAARRNDTDPTSVLVQLGLPVYITTDPFDTLAEALRAAGRAPVVEYARWNDAVLGPPAVWDSGYNAPTRERPLVYHLFGLWRHPESLILTEDDLLEFIVAARGGERIFPRWLRTLLTESTLIFVGFRLEDFEFRSAYRSILNWMSTAGGPGEPAHVAAQVEPDHAWVTDVGAARRYLSAYFNRSAVTILFGDLNHFAEQLRTKLTEREHARN